MPAQSRTRCHLLTDVMELFPPQNLESGRGIGEGGDEYDYEILIAWVSLLGND